MGYYVGRRGSLGVAKEATRGLPLNPTYWIPYNSITHDDKAIVVDQESAFGNIADSDNAFVTKKFGEGEFEADLDDKAIGLILTALMGAAPASTGGPTNYTHTFAFTNTNQHQSLSLLVQDPNSARMFPMGMLDKFEIKAEPEGLIKYTAAWRSRSGRDWTLQTASYTSIGNKFLQQHLVFKIAANIAGLAAASALNLRSLTLTFEKDVEDFDDLGTATPSDILNKDFKVTGTMEIGFSDNTYRNYMLNGDAKAIGVDFVYGANNQLNIQLPKVSFRNWEPNKGLNDIAIEKIEFKGHYDAVNAANIISTMTLLNQVASY